MALEPLHNNNNGNTSTANTCNDNSENNININTTNTTSTDIINNTTHKSVDNDSAVNEGSIVGLPVDSKSGTSSSSSDDDDDNDQEEEEEDSSSADELTAAGDALCRKLMMQEQLQHNKAMSMNQHHESSAAEPINSIEEHAVKNDNDDDDDDQGRPRQSLTEVETRSTPLPLQSPSFLPALSNGDHHDSNSNNNNNDNNKSLEERVQELETKLATLSRLLQQQQRLSFRSLLTRSPSNSQRSLIQQQQQQQQQQPQDGFSNNHNDDDDHHHHYRRDSSESPPPTQRTSHPTPSMVPYLESPAPFDDMSPRNRSLHQRKRLSFHLLYDGNEDNLRRADDEDHHGKGRPPFHDNNTHNSTNSSIMMMEMMQHNNNDNNQHNNNCMEDPDSMVQIMEHHTNTNNNNTNNHETSDGTGHQADHSSTTSNTHPENDVHPLKRSSSHENNNNINNHIITANDSQTMSIQVSQLDEQSAHEQKLHNNTIANVAARVVQQQQQQQQQQRQVQTKTNGVDEMDVSASTLGSGNMMIKKNQQQQQQQPSSSNHSSGTTHNSANSNTSKAAGEEFYSPTNNNNHHNNNNNNNNNASGGGGGDSNNNKIIKSAILPPLLLSKDKRSKWLDHLNSFQESNYDVDVQMQEFIKVPGAVERTLTSGFLICVDSFLYVCTILPIRFVWSCVLLSLHYFFRWTKKPAGNLQFHRRHTYQLVQVTIIVVIYRYVLIPISIGKLYHWIRGQAMIKLYVLIAIVEVFDRLMCSLGQDCLDSLYWNTTRRPRSSRMLISVSVVVVYTAVHSLILFVHVATLNVAMNSADEALLALLIAGNFAEIKSTVFKKYNKSSLFKIVASDICERFKLALFLGLVLLLNFCQGMDSRKMSDYQRIAGIVWMSELLCDWLKHAFITKFNFIPSTVYPEYGLLLAGDVTGIGHEGVNLDHSHAVVKRIGFAQMPLVCVMARLVREAAKYILLRIDSNAVPFFVPVLASTGCWIMLLVLKIFLGAYLQRTSLAKLHAAPELSQTPLKAKQKQQ